MIGGGTVGKSVCHQTLTASVLSLEPTQKARVGGSQLLSQHSSGEMGSRVGEIGLQELKGHRVHRQN